MAAIERPCLVVSGNTHLQCDAPLLGSPAALLADHMLDECRELVNKLADAQTRRSIVLVFACDAHGQVLGESVDVNVRASAIAMRQLVGRAIAVWPTQQLDDAVVGDVAVLKQTAEVERVEQRQTCCFLVYCNYF